MFLLKKRPHGLLLLPNLKSDSGSGFSKIFDYGSRSERKMQNPAGVDSGSPDPVPHLVCCFVGSAEWHVLSNESISWVANFFSTGIN